MTGEIIQIFYRAPWPVRVMKDGRERHIPVGYSHITADLLPYAKAQNPIPGSEDPHTLQFESLISYVVPKGDKKRKQIDPLDPIPAEVLQALPKERIDRSKLDPARQNAVERSTPFPRGRVGVEAPTEGMRDLMQSDRTGG